jgi:proteasome lid subunit RPN8/RPN11
MPNWPGIELSIVPWTSGVSLFRVEMTRAHRQAIVDHAQQDAPNECCGYLSARGGVVQEVFAAENERNSPYGYELPSKALLAANQLDDDGFEVGVYHSHPRSAAEPSQTDINLAYYPHWRYLIVSLRNGGGDQADLRAWKISDGRVEEEEIVVTD